jgi:hypothetical protein
MKKKVYVWIMNDGNSLFLFTRRNTNSSEYVYFGRKNRLPIKDNQLKKYELKEVR